MKEIRGMSFFSLYFLSLVSKSQLTFFTLFSGGCSKWDGTLLSEVGGVALGEAEDKHSILDAASGLQKQRFPVLCPGPQPEKQVDPSLFSQPLLPCRCHTQLTFGPALACATPS